jgi:hypothetical protein
MAAREVSPEAAISAGLQLVGDLARASTLRLFGLAAAVQANGELSISTEGRAVTYTLFFRRGAVEHAGSSDAADDLGRFLVRKGVLTPEKLVMVEAARPAAGGDFVGALIAARMVNPADVAGLLQERGLAIVSRALACEAGSFAWEPGGSPPPSSFPLGPPFGALCVAVRALDVSAVQRRLGAREKGVASRTVGRVKIEDLRLTPQEAKAAALFDGARSAAEIAAQSPGDAGVILRVALLLGELDLLAFGPPRASQAAAAPPPGAPAAAPPPAGPPPAAPPPAAAAAATPPPAAPPRPVATPPSAASPRPVATPPPGAGRPPPAPVRPAAAPPRPAATPPPAPGPVRPPTAVPLHKPAEAGALDPATLRAALEKQKGADHFQVLGVKRDSPLPAIKAAYFGMARTYHPDAVPADASPDVKKLCADVFARISEAWAVLGDEARKAEYVKELQSGGAADVDVMRILHAENVFQDATLLVKARRYDDALAKLAEAMQLNADEPEFGMWKAWCEFLLAPDKKRQMGASASVIEAALKKNPRCAPGYLFLGQMAKVVGDLSAAEKHLKRGLPAAPPTPTSPGSSSTCGGREHACRHRPTPRSAPSCPRPRSARRCARPATTSRRSSRWARRV